MASQAQGDCSPTRSENHSSRWIGGVVLIAIGVFLLVGQTVRSELLGLLFLPGLGALLLFVGVATRNAGFLIPGGILSGLGTGVYLVARPYAYLPDSAEAGITLLSLGGGFVVVWLTTAVVTSRAHWWALIPASITGLIGGALLAGEEGVRMLTIAGTYWPIVLIAIGALLLIKRGE